MMEIRQLSPAAGAEIRNLDVSTPVPEEDLGRLKDALCHHGMLLIRGQSLSQQQLVDFTKQLGPSESYEVVGHPFLLPGYPDIISISNVVENGLPIGVKDAGIYWHTDGSYLEQPAWASLLYALEVPQTPEGEPLGDTMFANMAAAFEALPAAEQERLKGLSALHQYVWRSHQQKEGEVPLSAIRPVVLKHPVTGKSLIYVNRGFTTRILDLPEDEASALLQGLCEHATQQAFRYTHKWRVGDVVLWDNYTVQHNAVPNYGTLRRRMWRTTVRGFPWRDGAFVS